MNIFDRFENTVERGVGSTFSRVFQPGIKPIDVSPAIRRSMGSSAKELSPGRAIVVNHFVVHTARSDFASLEANLEALADEFTLQATEHTTTNGYALLGPMHINFAVDDTEQTGQLRARSSNRRDPTAPVTASSPSPAHPIINVDDERWFLTEPVTIIGCGTEIDIVINDSGVSRRHLELRVTSTGVIATDLGSTNDAFAGGHKTDATTLLDGDRIMIGRTPTDFWTHPGSDGDQ